MFIQELLVHEARFEEELVRTQRHAPVLHTSYFEVRLVLIRHRSQDAEAECSGTHAVAALAGRMLWGEHATVGTKAIQHS